MRYMGFIWAGVWVQDLQASIAFYRDVLELPLLRQGEDYAHFDAFNGAILELMGGGTASRDPKGIDRQSIVLGLRVPDLNESVAELKSRGVVFLGEPGEYAKTRWAHFSDPEGNRLEIKEVPPRRFTGKL